MSAPSRRISLVGALLVAALLAPAVPVLGAALDFPSTAADVDAEARRARPSAAELTTPAPTEAEQLAAEVVRLTNLERAAAGRAPLAVHPAVWSAAMSHSADQAAMGRMSHTGSDGSDAGTRLTRAGFTWRTWGENVAAGQRTAADVVSAWMGSSVHRANILSSTFTVIGIGVATTANGTRYWTMDLAA
jgi:uncharacterized protein YkwD